MNSITISTVLALSLLLVSCGNKGDLFLKTDQEIADEIKALDDSLDELGDSVEEGAESDIDAELEAEEEIKKAKKKASATTQSEQ